MSARLTLVCHAPTAATTGTAFPADEPLDERGRGWAARAGAGAGRRVDLALRSPAPACAQTAAALGLTARVDPALRDWDLGRWRGHRFDAVATAEPAAIQAWLTEPEAAPHGGERLVDLLARVDGWLGSVPAERHVLAVSHPAVLRAAVVVVLGAPAAGFWRIDIAPLSATELRGQPGRWTLRSTGRPLRSPDRPEG